MINLMKPSENFRYASVWVMIKCRLYDIYRLPIRLYYKVKLYILY